MPEVGGQQVAADGHELERDVEQDEIAGRGHEIQAYHREEEQRIVLAQVSPVRLQVTGRHQHRDQAGHAEQDFEEDRPLVEGQHAGEGHPRLPGEDQRHSYGRGEPRQGDSYDRGPIGRGVGGAAISPPASPFAAAATASSV